MSVVANVAINVDAANAIQQLNRVKTAAGDVQGGFNAAANGAKGLGAALQAALGPLLTITTALATVKAGLDTAFERGAAEQRLRNLTSSTGEFNAAMALAADSASKFGLTQTDTTKALADVYGRLKGVGFGLQETGQIYQGFNAIALQSGLAGEEAAGAFFQLSQALGKGKLNGDEFVIVAERMPQLLDAIAQTTGRSRGELTQMAQDGKITSQVLYEALSGAAGAADGLNGKLTQQQQTFNNLRQVTDQLLNSIGQVFGPVVVAGAEGLAKAGQMLADWWSYIGNVIFPKVYEALQPVITSLKAAFEDIDFDAVRVAIQSILIKGFEIAIGVIGNFSKVLATVIDGFKALSQNPVFQFIAEQVGRLAGFLGISNDKVKEFKDEQSKVNQAAAESVKEYSSLPPKIDDAKEAAKKLKEAQKEVTDEIAKTIDQSDKFAQAQTTLVDQELSIIQARLQAESAINDVLLQQANSRLQGAQTEAERIKAAKEIYDLTVQQAEIERTSTLAAIEAEIQKAQILDTTAFARYKELQAIVKLAEAQGVVTEEHYEALAAQKEAGKVLENQYKTTVAVAEEQRRVADAVYDGKVQAAGVAYEQNKVFNATKNSANEADRYANNLARANSESTGILRNLEGVSKVSGNITMGEQFGAAGKNAAFMAEYAAAYNKFQQEALYGPTQKYGLVSGQQAWARLTESFMQRAEEYNRRVAAEQNARAVQEWQKYTGQTAGTPEMLSGIRRYGLDSGMSMTTPQVNITTGPVTQMGGTNYVTMSDLQQATSTAARQGANMALSQLQSNPSLRRTIGVTR